MIRVGYTGAGGRHLCLISLCCSETKTPQADKKEVLGLEGEKGALPVPHEGSGGGCVRLRPPEVPPPT